MVLAVQDGLLQQSLCSESKHANAQLYKDADDIKSVFTLEVVRFLELGQDYGG